MIKFIINIYIFYSLISPVSLVKTTKSLYEMADDYEDDKNSVIAISEKDTEDVYDEFYDEKDIEYIQQSSMDILFFGPPESFMRLDAESILHILSNIKKKHLIPINKVLQAWDIITGEISTVERLFGLSDTLSRCRLYQIALQLSILCFDEVLFCRVKNGKTAAYLQGREYLAFGSLLNVIPEEDLYYTNMGDESVRKYFAQFSEGLQFRKFGILIASYRRYYGSTWYLDASTVNQLGYMICGFPPSELKKISSSVMKELKNDVLGKLKRCNDEQVQTLYNLAVQPDVFGEPYRWTSHEVSRLGTLLKCIPANELSSIQLEAMPAISEEVIKHFSQHKLTQFTKQQIMKMNPLTRRIYILRIQLKSSLDVNELSKRDAISVGHKSTSTLIVCFVYFIIFK